MTVVHRAAQVGFNTRILEGAAESMSLEAGTALALVCAQAFHWFANETALGEIHRVLKPGGRLGLIWSVRDESVDWVAAITSIITPYEGDTAGEIGNCRSRVTTSRSSSCPASTTPM